MATQYYTEYGRVMNIRSNRESFAQLVGEHACRMTELTKAEGNNSKRKLMSTWVDLHKLNHEWAGLVTRGERNDETEFSRVTHQLIEMYSEALGDYVLDKASGPEWREKIGNLVTMEQRFFEALGGNLGTSQSWAAYTASVIDMVNAMDRYGHESESFHEMAANCIRNGVLLGSYLDYSLKSI
jgi:hypothetical protein